MTSKLNGGNRSFHAAEADRRDTLEQLGTVTEVHVSPGVSLRAAEAVDRDNFSAVETAGVLRAVADYHKKDASMLRAPLWEDKNNAT